PVNGQAGREPDYGDQADHVRGCGPSGDEEGRGPAGRRGEVHDGPGGPARGDREVLRRAVGDQGRRVRQQGDHAPGSVREHGRQDGQRGRQEDGGQGRRRHDRGDRAGPGHFHRGAAPRRGRGEPGAAPAREQRGGGGRGGGHRRDGGQVQGQGRLQEDRDDLGEQQPGGGRADRGSDREGRAGGRR